MFESTRPPDWISPAEVARRLGKHPRTVLAWLRQGKLEVMRVNRKTIYVRWPLVWLVQA